MRICVVIGALVLLTCVASCFAQTFNDNEQDIDHAKSVRVHFALPKLFDFAQYKRLFHKSYNSLLEEVARRKFFLARAVQALISTIRYKHGFVEHFLRVNQMSDLGPKELDKRTLTAEHLYFQNPMISSIADNFRDDSTAGLNDKLFAAEPSDIEQVIEEMVEHRERPGFKEIVEELEPRIALNRRRRDATEDDEFFDASEDGGFFDASDDKESWQPVDPTTRSSQVISAMGQMVSKVPGVEYLKSLFYTTADELSTHADDEPKIVWPDAVYVDHRKSNCFAEVRDQGECGGCWAFSVISLFEWMFCKQTGKLEEFSEQFLLDCSQNNDPTVSGCVRGNPTKAIEFTFKHGLHPLEQYPFLGKTDGCPYDDLNDSVANRRTTKLSEHKLDKVVLSKIDASLTRSPMLVGITIDAEFYFYGGGVRVINERTDAAHVMVLVGSGREDDLEYYQFRNSHSPAWGENGYFKLEKSSLRKCLFGGAGLQPTGQFL